MKISFFGHYSIYANWVLNALIRALPEVQFQRAYFSGCEHKNGKLIGKPFRNSQVEGYVALKTIEQSLWLEQLFPLFDESHSEDQFLSFDALSKSSSIEFIAAPNPNSRQILQLMQEDDADLFLSVRYAGLFKDEALAIPKKGIINLHSSILPNYKGLENTMHAILNGAQQIGYSLHWINRPYPEVDTGPIIGQSRLNINFGRSLSWNCFQLYPAGSQLIIDAIRAIKTNQLNANLLPPQPKGGTYFSAPTNENYAQLEKMGMPIFDTEELTQLVRKYYAPDFHFETMVRLFEKNYPHLAMAKLIEF